MLVDLDDIVNKLTGWNLQLKVDGKTINIAPPTNALITVAGGIKDRGVVPQDVVPQMKEALATVVDPAISDVSTWSTHHLLGAITAIYEHAKDTLGKNLGGIASGVRAAMQAQKPAAVQPAPAGAAIPSQSSSAQSSASSHAAPVPAPAKSMAGNSTAS